MQALRSNTNWIWLTIPLLIVLCLLMSLMGRSSSRDFSKPSSRLVGHWAAGNEHYYLGSIDPITRIGRYVEIANGIPRFSKYRVMSDRKSGSYIRIEKGDPDNPFLRVDMRINKDGTEATANRCIARMTYVDCRVIPLGTFAT